MKLWEAVRLAFRQLREEKLKTAFSLLGVTIGVTFLVTVVSVVEGMDRYVMEDLASELFGLNTIQVRRAPAVQVTTEPGSGRAVQRRPRVTREDADVLRGTLSVPSRVGVESMLSAQIRSPTGERAEGVRVSAASQEIFEIRSLRVEEGRLFSPQEAEHGVAVVVLGRAVADVLFPRRDPIGGRVRIRGLPYRVVGVLEEQGTLFGLSMDNRALVPATSHVTRHLPERRGVGTILVQPVDPRQMEAALEEAEAALRVARGVRPGEENDFTIETAEESLAFWNQIALVLFLALPGLVGISLVVGGIVIMNIMLMSVAERTREIGIRMAIGARRRDIVRQFLVEAGALSTTGAVLGVLIGLALTAVVRISSPLPAAVAPHWIALGVALGVAVGVAAGVYPALQASRLDPVDALRHE